MNTNQNTKEYIRGKSSLFTYIFIKRSQTCLFYILDNIPCRPYCLLTRHRLLNSKVVWVTCAWIETSSLIYVLRQEQKHEQKRL